MEMHLETYMAELGTYSLILHKEGIGAFNKIKKSEGNIFLSIILYWLPIYQ